MELPPGIAYIAANAHRVVLPPAIAFYGINLYSTFFNVSMPIWLQLPLCLLSLQLALSSSTLYANFRDQRQAAMNGAILAPRVPSKWPGGLDILLPNVRNFRRGYLGACDVDQRLHNPFILLQEK